MNIHEMSVADRRAIQQEAGLGFQPRLEVVVNESNTTGENARSNERTEARKVLHRLSQDESFKGIVLHELKRAAVVVPIFVTAALGVLWANKRWIAR